MHIVLVVEGVEYSESPRCDCACLAVLLGVFWITSHGTWFFFPPLSVT